MAKGLKLIGKGAFTKCYLNLCETTVTLVSCDPIKECMAHGWFPESELFPTVEFNHQLDTKEGYQGYTMEYYPRTKGLKGALDPDQWLLYKNLKALCDPFGFNHPRDRFQALHTTFDKIQNEDVRDTLKDALDACSNYGQNIGFEISPRNVAVKNGKLILLDVFFMIDTLNDVRTGKI